MTIQSNENYDNDIISLGEINLYLNMLENLNKIRYEVKDYDKMIVDLKSEFNISISKDRLILLFEGSDELNQEIDERYYLVKNIFG